MKRKRISANLIMISFFSGILLLVVFHRTAFAQELPTKIRISNSGLSVTALPLVAAREWNFFREQGLQAEIIMMNPAISNPALVVALEKLGFNPKDFIILTTPTPELLRSLESGFVDAASLNPPTVFFAQRKGFHRVLDIGSLVEMPGGGLTTLIKTITSKPDEVRKVIRALQTAKDVIRKSKDKTLELMVRALKMDRDIASSTYDVYLTSLSIDGVPAREGMNNLVRSVKSQARFADRNVSFEEVADDTLAKQVAKELGYKVK